MSPFQPLLACRFFMVGSFFSANKLLTPLTGGGNVDALVLVTFFGWIMGGVLLKIIKFIKVFCENI